uniref:WW domain-containing protein n=1 Tax=Guillardia theta TaxID=55529 RepID=A0A7S4KAF5_GUITH
MVMSEGKVPVPASRRTAVDSSMLSKTRGLLYVSPIHMSWSLPSSSSSRSPPAARDRPIAQRIPGVTDQGKKLRGLPRASRRYSLTALKTSAQASQWREVQDPASGSMYYWNVETGETTWDVPAAFSPSSSQSQAAQSSSSDVPVQIRVSDDYKVIEDCAAFFLDSFWEHSTSMGPQTFDAAQKRELLECQRQDLQERYGKLVGERKLKSSLLLVQGNNGMIQACCGIEVSVVDKEDITVLSRERGENMLKGGLSALGGRARNELRKAPLIEVANAVLPENYGLIPVLSNLAVSERSRGSGLGRRLCQECESIVKSWGFREIFLLVEEQNVAARKLYESLGYQTIWNRPVDTVRVCKPKSDGSCLELRPIPTIAMVKQIF